MLETDSGASRLQCVDSSSGLAMIEKAKSACIHSTNRVKRFKKPNVKRGLTAYLFVPAAVGILILFIGYCAGCFPWWTNLIVAFPLYWYCYMTAHDAVHRSAHYNLAINNWVGWISTGLFALPFPLMRRAHLSHHAHAGSNDDIEKFAYRSSWRLPFGVIFGNLFFYTHFRKCNSFEKQTAFLMALLIITLVAISPTTMLLGWVLPMQLVFGLGMFTNIYLPHGHFHKWVETHIPFITGFHEDHHAMPSFPWHQLCQCKIRLACRHKRDSR